MAQIQARSFFPSRRLSKGENLFNRRNVLCHDLRPRWPQQSKSKEDYVLYFFVCNIFSIFFPFSSSACTVPSIEELPRENIKLLSDRKSFLMFAGDWLDLYVNIRFQRTWKLKDLISHYDWRTGTINAEIVK